MACGENGPSPVLASGVGKGYVSVMQPPSAPVVHIRSKNGDAQAKYLLTRAYKAFHNREIKTLDQFGLCDRNISVIVDLYNTPHYSPDVSSNQIDFNGKSTKTELELRAEQLRYAMMGY